MRQSDVSRGSLRCFAAASGLPPGVVQIDERLGGHARELVGGTACFLDLWQGFEQEWLGVFVLSEVTETFAQPNGTHQHQRSVRLENRRGSQHEVAE